MSAPMSLVDRIASRCVEDENGCWLWQGAVFTNGYGAFTYQGTSHRAHRASYQAFVGEIPSGLQLDHTCHSTSTSCPGGVTCHHRRCVRPDHLDPVPQLVNALRSRRSRCGTHSGYVLHGYYKTPICDACRDAHRAYGRRLRATAKKLEAAA